MLNSINSIFNIFCKEKEENWRNRFPIELVKYYIIPYLSNDIEINNVFKICNLHFNNINNLKINLINPNIFTTTSYLKYNIKTLEIDNEFGNSIDNTILSQMINLKILYLKYNTSISDNGLKYMTKIKELSLPINMLLTDTSLSYIPNVKKLNLNNNRSITDAGLWYIPDIRELFLLNNINITNYGLWYIPKIQFLFLNKNINITFLDMERKPFPLLKKLVMLNLEMNCLFDCNIIIKK